MEITDRPRAAAPAVAGRDRYLDLLRALALVRVVAFHTFNAWWLTLVFPAMGVMFALAGSLMARSLDRPAPAPTFEPGETRTPRSALGLAVLARRARRLLLPLWAYAIVVLAALTLAGWRPLEEGVAWPELLLWFVPIGDAPFPESLLAPEALGTEWGTDTWVILWYIRTYFWLMLLSPLLLRVFRRFPWPTLLTPLALAVLVHVMGGALPDWAAEPVTDLTTYGACWMLGFAHRDGLLHGLAVRTVALLGVAGMALGSVLLLSIAWTVEDVGLDLNNAPVAQAFYSLGFVALLFRVSPAWQSFPGLLRVLDRPVTLLNNRALTVYLWHNLLVVLTYPVVDTVLWGNEALADSAPLFLASEWPSFILVWVFLALAILAVGWVEDVAARRPIALWPDGRARSGA